MPSTNRNPEGLADLGFRIEDVVNQEHDAALGNGGLGRLAACFLDSMASLNYPAWGYGLRYRYGIFKQEIENGYQVEIPDYWLDFNPWEFARHDVTVDVQFFGWVNKYTDDEGKQVVSWQDGEIVTAVAYDVPVPGYGTSTVNNLRLWSSKASSGEFDFSKFNSGEYESAVADQQRAETISAVLYPNDNLERGKELRLKQQYFWCAASLSDIVRRFKKTNRKWSEFPDQVAIQLNDTHPTLAIVELQRILVDKEGLEWQTAWDIVTKTFSYTNHTVLPEALEKWSVPLIQNLLPRHLQVSGAFLISLRRAPDCYFFVIRAPDSIRGDAFAAQSYTRCFLFLLLTIPDNITNILCTRLYTKLISPSCKPWSVDSQRIVSC